MKILVVDDELPIRSWIEFTLKKTNYNFERIDLVSNGKQALEAFYNNFYDVIFTDIRMPIMDGIELSRTIKEHYPDTVIIILTAYNDFELARNALSIKADKYILKTEIDENTLSNIIDNINTLKEPPLYIKDSIDHFQRETLLRKIADKKIAGRENITEHLIKNSIKLTDASLFSIAISFEDEHNYTQLRQKIYALGKESLRNILLFSHKSKLFVVGNMHGNLDYQQKQACLQEIATSLLSCFPVSLGFSMIYDDISLLPSTLYESESALSLSFYHPEKRVYFYEPQSNCEIYEEYCDTMISELYKSLKAKNYKASKDIVNSWLDKIKSCMINDISFIKKLSLDVLSAYKVNCDKSINKDSYLKISNANTYVELRECLLSIASSTIVQNAIPTEKASRYTWMAIEYTNSNYSTINGIPQVTNFLHINPEYFCRLFKKETGMTYNTYLTNFRLEKAAELLLNSNLKVYEVAQQVGYSNVGYFTRIFKKKYNCNPFEFRNKISEYTYP